LSGPIPGGVLRDYFGSAFWFSPTAYANEERPGEWRLCGETIQTIDVI